MPTVRKTSSILLLAALLAIAAGCAQQPQTPAPPPDTRPQHEAAIRQGSKDALAAAQAKDADKFVSFYTADAVAYFPSAPPISGRDKIREAIAQSFQDPNFSLTWTTTKVEVARSGDIAYETGAFEETVSDARKKPVKHTGTYLVVLKKQADGSWKVIYDVGHRNPAVTP